MSKVPLDRLRLHAKTPDAVIRVRAERDPISGLKTGDILLIADPPLPTGGDRIAIMSAATWEGTRREFEAEWLRARAEARGQIAIEEETRL